MNNPIESKLFMKSKNNHKKVKGKLCNVNYWKGTTRKIFLWNSNKKGMASKILVPEFFNKLFAIEYVRPYNEIALEKNHKSICIWQAPYCRSFPCKVVQYLCVVYCRLLFIVTIVTLASCLPLQLRIMFFSKIMWSL